MHWVKIQVISDQFFCKATIEIRPIPVHPEIKGWWYKPMFFNPGLGLNGTMLYMDLDVIMWNVESVTKRQKQNQFICTFGV